MASLYDWVFGPEDPALRRARGYNAILSVVLAVIVCFWILSVFVPWLFFIVAGGGTAYMVWWIWKVKD